VYPKTGGRKLIVGKLRELLKSEVLGPRPNRIASLEDYDDEISNRLNMRPGMTGMAQVSWNIYLTGRPL